MKQELNFHDKDTQFYRFMEADFDLNHTTNEKDSKDDELQESLSLLVQMGPDALLTMILRKWWDTRNCAKQPKKITFINTVYICLLIINKLKSIIKIV